MKKLVVLVAIILSLGFASACDSSQVILRLSSSSNAHGATWEYTAYTTEICYNEIFPQAPPVSTPHTCSSSNRILSLSSSYNAHAGIPGTYGNNDVCYGNLACVKKENQDCSGSEKLIVSLSSETNAHLSSGNDYPIKICCRIGGEISQANWKNLKNEIITESDKGDSVKLVVEGAGLTEINYTIYKDNAFWFDKKIATISSSSGEMIWQASSEGTYYFRGYLSGGSYKQSSELEVGVENNSEINLTLFEPKDKQIYFLREILNLSAVIGDEDDKVYYSWDFGDGTIKTGQLETMTSLDFDYPYSTTGQKNILLKAWNSRDQEVKKRISILVINSTYILAYIGLPEYGKGYGRIVNFDASSSYAVDYDHSAGTIACVMGNCPSKTEGCPLGSGAKPGCQIAVSGTPKGYDSANFTWVFDANPETNKSGSGSSNVVFSRLFPEPGEHLASLLVSINPTSSVQTEFNTIPEDAIQCVSDEQESHWYYPSGEIENSIENCYLGEIDDVCCPDYYSCDQETGECTPDNKLACSDYTTEADCIQDDSNVAESDIDFKTDETDFCSDYTEEISENCWRYPSNCRCWWNLSSGTCDSAYTMKTECLGDDEPTIEGECIFTTIEDTNCSLGYRYFEWTANWDPGTDGVGNPDCKDGSEQVPCLSETLLGFFDNVGLILAIVLLVVVYWIIVHNKKHHSTRKKKR